MSARIALLVLLSVLIGALQAASTVDVLAFESAEQQRRYKALIDEFRCPKCLNTNLSGSDAPIAQDLRHSVYRLVRAGQSDQQIRDFLQQRYGDFVLYKPPFSGRTAFIWLIPIGLLLIGAVVLFALQSRGRRRPIRLSVQEAKRVDQLLADDD
ncbi:MAG: cytochrome c-type biogenesis protein CcmH [Gammaproteobacteria bacterium]|nr:cytochrome c-type biogenesis protein CcmH [Gammaproteobacteria bacterium]|tara:strand:+ start:562 stop:1023 length:462 start_codon:yes stop_codon:yes gene_type:complete